MAKENPTIPKVWITRYALTKGTMTAENVEHCLSSVPTGKMICDRRLGGYSPMYHLPDWHLTEQAAVARVLEMIQSRRESLLKTGKKLDRLWVQYSSMERETKLHKSKAK